MLKKMTIFKLGDTYKYVCTNLKSTEEKIEKVKHLNNNEKYFNNLVRAKTEIKNLILCNNFKYFVTLTFNDKFNRFDLKGLRNKINNKIRKTRKKYNLELSFLLIPEQHKNGAWHFHGVFNSSFDKFMYINSNNYLSCNIFEYFGFNSISLIEDKDKVSSYITKYVTKDFSKRKKGEHLYFASQNLIKPEKIDSFEFELNNIAKNFFDYENDYCKIKTTKNKIFLKSILTLKK